MSKVNQVIANELNISVNQVNATTALLDEGATVPFIARYRKEITGSLDDSQLRKLEERLRYLRELEDRKVTILKSIEEQGKLNPELQKQINDVETKNELEDIYLPYKPKRRTKGQIAIEAGLEPLADALFADHGLDPSEEAKQYINPDKSIDDVKAALDGAKFILMERFSENAQLLGKLKQVMWDEGVLFSQVDPAKQEQAQKFRDYFDYQEAINKIPSHRALALFRGRNESFLNLQLKESADSEPSTKEASKCERIIGSHFEIRDNDAAASKWLNEVVRWTWRVKLSNYIETELLGRLRDAAEETAITVFSENIKDLLMAAPAGPKAAIGLDPGLRTGVKVAVVDHTGKLLDYATIYPHAPQNRWDDALETIAALAKKYEAELVSIGNGTASRETEKLAGDVSKRYPDLGLKKIIVNEAGASVYSASEFAAKEFPDLDVTIRGAVSIARRLQDPLAELVKIEPKAIGVGQYQHDVSQVKLSRSLDAVVEDCVNAVGVDLNTASAPLLSRVSGLNQVHANNIVSFRDANGAFTNREELKSVPRLGDKTFEQAAGFLRVPNGSNPLDNSAVHPESYKVVNQISTKAGSSVSSLIGNDSALKSIKVQDFVSEGTGEQTVKDILAELAKPGRDPRPEFTYAAFKEGVETINDLKTGMVLEGSVTNVTHFGAFVDIGVHQDGLVHISALANKFVKDPREVVKTGDIVKVKVMEVDVKRKRIGLSMRMDDSVSARPAESKGPKEAKPKRSHGGRHNAPSSKPAMAGAMAQAFAKIKT